MISFLFQWMRGFRPHPSDRMLTDLVSDEVSASERLRLLDHLCVCPRCRTRRDRFERIADLMARSYARRIDRVPPVSSSRRQLLTQQLLAIAKEEHAATQTEGLPRKLFVFRLPAMTPTLATAIVLAIASVGCFLWWQLQERALVSPDTLLARATFWELNPEPHHTDGVVQEEVRIASPGHVVLRTIHRDLSGKLTPRKASLSTDDERIRTELARAGVSWDAPLSAASYRNWANRQSHRKEQVRRSGKHLLVLTTESKDGPVAKQSLTVRDADFRPIGRTVALRGAGPIEIAEVSYEVVPWERADANWFESLPGLVSGPVPALRLTDRSAPAIGLPTPVSEAQLDEAELSVRLVLNHLHADTGEQIDVDREPTDIRVKGLVDSNDRKQELRQQLRSVPHVRFDVLSISDMEKRPVAGQEITKVTADSLVAQVAPLEAYLVSSGRGTGGLSGLSQRLFNSALTVDLESKAISDLLARFAAGPGMSASAQATLNDLVERHRVRLIHALEDEEGFLAEARGSGTAPAEHNPSPADTAALLPAGERNLALCKELILGNSAQPRAAAEIMGDLSRSIAHVRQLAKAIAVDGTIEEPQPK